MCRISLLFWASIHIEEESLFCMFKLSPLRLTLGQGLEKRRKAVVFSSCRNNLIKIQKNVGLEKTLSLYMSGGW